VTAPLQGRFVGAALALIAVDQATKLLAARTLKGLGRLSYLADTFRLQYAENPGAFLSLGASLSPGARNAVFVIGTGALLVGCVVMLLREAWTERQQIGWWLVIAGGAANLIDRVARGAVIDFLNVGIGPVRTGIFNVADMAIMLGVGLLLLPGRRRG
jgi:signal peptidase II